MRDRWARPNSTAGRRLVRNSRAISPEDQDLHPRRILDLLDDHQVGASEPMIAGILGLEGEGHDRIGRIVRNEVSDHTQPELHASQDLIEKSGNGAPTGVAAFSKCADIGWLPAYKDDRLWHGAGGKRRGRSLPFGNGFEQLRSKLRWHRMIGLVCKLTDRFAYREHNR